MDSLLEKIFEWIRQGLIDSIMASFTGMYDTINQKVGEIAGQVGQTPEAFNSGVFSMIRNLSETAVLPIAGMILTFVMCYELINMITEKNNMHEFDTFNLYKWIFKTFVAVYILTHTFDIVMGVFELGQSVVNRSAGIISGSLNVGAGTAIDALRAEMEAMGVWELIGLWFEMNIIGLCLQAISICIFLIIFGRMLEIYLTVSIAPIPLATMVNRDELCCKGVRTTRPTKSAAAGSFVADSAWLAEEGDEVYCDSRSRCSLWDTAAFRCHKPPTRRTQAQICGWWRNPPLAVFSMGKASRSGSPSAQNVTKILLTDFRFR